MYSGNPLYPAGQKIRIPDAIKASSLRVHYVYLLMSAGRPYQRYVGTTSDLAY